MAEPNQGGGSVPIPTRDVTIGDVGEHAVIAAIREVAPSRHNGDDAAVLAMTTPNASHVATTDLVVEGRHFDLRWSSPEQVGRKAAIQNFADVESMGARPKALLMGLSAPESTPLSTVTGIARGLAAECGRCAAELVGGDIVGGASLVISITAIGEVGGPELPLLRSGARPGDAFIAAGPIGRSAAGLALLRHYGSSDEVPERFAPLIDAHRVPEFSYGRGAIARADGVTALTDNSDGLLIDVAEIAAQSGVHVDLDPVALVPDELVAEAAADIGADANEWVLSGGEDHTLLGTTAGDAPVDFRVIGHVTRAGAGGPAVTIGGAAPAPGSTGWVSF